LAQAAGTALQRRHRIVTRLSHSVTIIIQYISQFLQILRALQLAPYSTIPELLIDDIIRCGINNACDLHAVHALDAALPPSSVVKFQKA
jgi:hypothetical protein